MSNVIASVYPLNPMQEGMLYHYLADGVQDSYLEQGSVRVQGKLNVANFECAFNYVIGNNETLRSVIKWTGVERPVQIILKSRPQKLREFDFTGLKPEELEIKMEELREADRKEGFDLERGPLIRLTAVRIDEDIWDFIWTFQHMVLDGWSSGLAWDEFFKAYNLLESGQPLPVVQKPGYREYINYLNKCDKAEAASFWREYLKGYDTPVTFPVDFTSEGPSEPIAEVVYLPPDLAERTAALCKEQKIVPNLIFQLVWGILLQRYNNCDDAVFGATVAGRPYRVPGVQEIMGVFLNTVPSRIKTLPQDTALDILNRFKKDIFQRNKYEHSALLDIKAESEIKGVEQLFDNIVVFESFSLTDMAFDSGIKILNVNNWMNLNYDLSLHVNYGRQVRCKFLYKSGAFKASTIGRLIGHFLHILEQIVTNPLIRVSDLELLTLAEKVQVVEEFNRTNEINLTGPMFDGQPHSQNLCVQQLFEAQVERTPDAPAVFFEGQLMSYRELNADANRLARYLTRRGVGRGSLVALIADRSFAMVAGLLAILKAGAGYLPIDPLYPAERVSYMLEDARATVLLTGAVSKVQEAATPDRLQRAVSVNGELAEPLASSGPDDLIPADYQGKVIRLSAVLPELRDSGEDATNLPTSSGPEDLVYVIYTSGSTGKPKGVALEHRNLVNLLNWELQETNIDYTGRMLQFTSLSFDVSFQEIFTPLAAGGTVYLISDEKRKDLPEMLHFLREQEIEIISFPFSYLNFMFEDQDNIARIPRSLKHIITAGEQLIITDNLRAYLKANHVYLHNHYGPSETHVVTALTLGGEGELPPIPSIGRPISHVQIYILDQQMRPQPVGIPGEIYIAGTGVGRGYLHRPDLTAERFIPNIFGAGRMYKTGDLGCWTEDGQIEFLGRLDYQVKIRGFRVEIGEVEAALLTHPEVKQAVVLDKKDTAGRKYLVGYIVGSEVPVSELRAHLLQTLPDYMVPSAFIFLSELPLTPSGKINRKALPEPAGAVDTGVTYAAPRNEKEEAIAKIWAEVLGLKRVGIHDNFFELGGHSLKATQVMSRIFKEMGVLVNVRTLFTAPTIAQFMEVARLAEPLEKLAYQQIVPVSRHDYYPLSHAQRRLWILYQLEDMNPAYNMPTAFTLRGRLNRTAFEDAFRTVVERHETLRTYFATVDDVPVQVVEDGCPVKMQYIDWERRSAGTVELQQFVNTEAMRPFDLTKPGLIRAILIRLSDTEHLCLITMHHIISDGWSDNIFVQEIGLLYDAFVRGQANPLPPLKIQYRDFAIWQEELLQSEKGQAQEQYWLKQLGGGLPVLNLPTDYSRPDIRSHNGSNYLFTLDRTLAEAIKTFTRNEELTLFMLFCAGFNLLLGRYSEQEDIVIGSPIAGRSHSDLEALIGFFVNTLVMRTRFQMTDSVRTYLQRVKQVTLDAFENQEYPFDLLVDQLALEVDLSRSPLFDVMFNWLNVGDDQSQTIALTDVTVSPFELIGHTSRFDLLLTMSEMNGELIANFEYCTDLFTEATIRRMSEHLTTLLWAMVSEPDSEVGKLDMLSAEERRLLLCEFNDNAYDYGGPLTVHAMFEEVVKASPERVALRFHGETLTYGELNAKANRLARYLRKNGIGRDTLVGIMIDRSFAMIIGLLGIMKAGGAYSPVDPLYPVERVSYILKSAQAPILLTGSASKAQVPASYTGRVVVLDEVLPELEEDSANLDNINDPHDLIYVIYTSGSTGEPKGASVEHINVANLLYYQARKTTIDYSGRLLQFTSLSFDVSAQEIFGSLVAGGTLCLITDEERKDLPQMFACMEEQQVEIISFPFSYLNFMFEDEENIKHLPRSLKHIITAGEQLIITDNLREFLTAHPEIHLHNHYGPTETQVMTIWTYPGSGPLPKIPSIGKPVCNTWIYILDRGLNPVPLGVPGEIYIAGICVGRGYLHSPQLTAERYLPNPFAPGRMYKTGDLGRWTPEGEIEFMGRLDYQVKIRGFRVEIGEVESALLNHSAVKHAAVVDKKDANGRKYLAAYLVLEDELSTIELRNHLLQTLPDYMVPSTFTVLDALPLTPSGKVDRKTLRALKEENVAGEEDYVAPRTATEEAIAKIWAEVLELERVGIRDNFFELGGHSLRATRAVSKINKELGIAIPLRVFFTNPTIAGIMEKVQATVQVQYVEITPRPAQSYYELSHAQRRLWTINQLAEANVAYNMPSAFIIKGELNRTAFEQALQTIIERHEILRTRFAILDGEPAQVVENAVHFSLNYLDRMPESTGMSPVAKGGSQGAAHVEVDTPPLAETGMRAVSEAAITELIARESMQPFDLTKPGLLRATLVKLQESEYLFVFTMHHIITDGWSNDVLVRELMILYNVYTTGGANPLPPLKIQYRDYSAWQNDLLNSPAIKVEEEYWQNHLQGELPTLNLPVDFKRPLIQTYVGDNLNFELSEEVVRDLHDFATTNGATLFMTLFAAYNLLLFRYSGQEDIIVGTPIAGRPHRDLEELIGFFVNTLALRTEINGAGDFMQLLHSVKEIILNAFENQNYPFDALVERLEVVRDMSRSPVFDTVFVLQTSETKALTLDKLSIIPVENNFQTSRFDLTLTMSEINGKLWGSFNYNSDLFKRETIARMAEHFTRLLENVRFNPLLPLSEIEMFSATEKARILEEFNATRTDYPRDKGLHQLFEEQVARHQNRTAVVYRDEAWTYGELNTEANKLAFTLRRAGVKADTPVGVLVDRSLAMIATLVGIIKAGGAYVPLDPTQPTERIAFMLEDSGAKHLVVQSALSDVIPANYAGVVISVENTSAIKPENVELSLDTGEVAATSTVDQFGVDEFTIEELVTDEYAIDEFVTDEFITDEFIVDEFHDAECIVEEFVADASLAAVPSRKAFTIANLAPISGPDNLAYIMYTSGSTGQPKGVLIKQHSVTRVALNTNYLQINEDDKLLQISNYTFDGSTFDIWGALLNGAKLVLITREELFSLTRMAELIKTAEISVLFIPTAFFNNMADLDPEVFAGMRKITFGGERTSVPHVAKVFGVTGPGVLMNVYGPTEATVFSTFYPIEQNPLGQESLPIGKPVANTSVYILDKYLEPVPIGVTGELYIGGDALARGYLNQPELTAERFIPSPFVAGEYLYKSGDLGKYLPDGNIEFMGRVDNQVKIRGFRIEPGEVEAAILTHPAVREAVVIDRLDDQRNRYLAAYVTLVENLTVRELKDYLAQSLPEYMVPGAFVVLEELPLTRHGKVDRRALPEPEGMAMSDEYVAPRTELEAKMVAIWAEVLGVAQIGIHDNFFELGGYSMKATLILARIRKELGLAIPLKVFFQSPTIAGILEGAGAAVETDYQGIPAYLERAHYPLSPAQYWLWLTEQISAGNAAYHIPFALTLEGQLNVPAFEKALHSLVQRHEILRTRFAMVEGEPVQIVEATCPVNFQYIESEPDDLMQYMAEEAFRPFDLTKPGLMRVRLRKLAPAKHLLMIILHHIISDGWSILNVAMREIAACYNALLALDETAEPANAISQVASDATQAGSDANGTAQVACDANQAVSDATQAGKGLAQLPPLPVQYRDYAIYQNAMLESERWKEQEEYWLARLTGVEPELHLPKDFPAVDLTMGNGRSEVLLCAPELLAKLREYSEATGVTPYMATLAAFNIVLFKLTRAERIVVGTPVTGRTHREVENLLGIFLNTLLIVTEVGGDPTFGELLQRERESVLGAFDHQDLPFERVLQKLNYRPEGGRSTYFNVMVNYIPGFGDATLELAGLKVEMLTPEEESAKFELDLYIQETPLGLSLRLNYRKDLFSAQIIKRMLEQLNTVLEQGLANPTIRLSEIQFADATVTNELLDAFTNDLDDDF